MTLFSIIIPTYNRVHLIGRTIQSCLNQTYPNFEIIVVDDGSTDNTEQVIKSIQSPKIKYFKIPNSERGYARNFGIKQSIGNYITFLDSDDTLFENYLSEAHRIILQHPDIPVFHCGYSIVDINFNTIENLNNFKNISQLLLTTGNILGCHGIFIRQDVTQQFPFNEDRTIAGLEDWELWIRISTQYEIKHFPVITSALIHHNDRSVMQIDKERWIKKVETFIQYVTNNPDVKNKFGQYFPAFYASAYSYLALHLSFNKAYRKYAWQYFIKAMSHYPQVIFTRRAAAILKRIILF